MTSPQPLVESVADLEVLVSRLRGGDAVALDTEFMRERTYRAELCLLQLGTDELTACVDPIALAGTLEALSSLLRQPSLTKVLHAARQDLEVLVPAVGSLSPVYDTQIAAALAGFPAQIGYADLCQQVLGVTLEKGQTRTDWARRPLTADQLRYAHDDVRWLLPLRQALDARLAGLGRSAWLAEELVTLEVGTRLVVDPDRAWQKIRGLRALDPGRLELARALGAWRERRAMEKNRPRGWILDDEPLREMIHRVPRSLDELAGLPQMPEGVVRRQGDELLAIIAAARLPDPPPPLPRPERPDPRIVERGRRLSTLSQAIARELALAPEILATRRDLDALAAGEREVPVLRGWRREVVGERLLAALAEG